jgi:AcrR family transcriptional regulator
MPKVTEEHIQARRRQILDAARRCFARQGLHRTTMQDIFGEAELSAGAVYTYFGGKGEIVWAIADEVFGQIRHELSETESLEDAFDRLMAVFDYVDGQPDLLPMLVAFWAEAMREPTLMAAIRRAVDHERKRIAAVAAADHDDPDATARAVIALLHGLMLQRCWYPRMDVGAYKTAARALVAGG